MAFSVWMAISHPYPTSATLLRNTNAMLLVDDAHGFGVLGKNGSGTVSHFGLEGKEIIQMGTLSKSVGALGGYIAGSHALIELLINRARGFIFTTGLPPATLAAANTALDVIRFSPELRQHLLSHARKLKTALTDLGYTLLPSETQILPVVFGSPQRATRAAEALLSEGVFRASNPSTGCAARNESFKNLPSWQHTQQQKYSRQLLDL